MSDITEKNDLPTETYLLFCDALIQKGLLDPSIIHAFFEKNAAKLSDQEFTELRSLAAISKNIHRLVGGG